MTFVTRMTSGDFGLARTYWRLGVLGNIVAVACTMVVGEILEGNPQLWMGLAGWLVCVMVLYYALLAWIGVWSSAARYTGRRVWAWLATVTGLMGVICVLTAAAMAVTM